MAGVTISTQTGGARLHGRLVYVLDFANGIPSNVGLQIRANAGASDIVLPFRFQEIPIPAMLQG